MRRLLLSIVACLALFGHAHAFLASNNNTPLTCSVPITPQAAAQGFTKVLLCENWSEGAAAIDVNATGAPGYAWYTLGYFGAPITAAADVSVSAGILILGSTNAGEAWNNGGQSYRSRLVSAGYLGAKVPGYPNASTATVGQTYGPGGDYEACFAYNESQAPAGGTWGWPAFWLPSLQGVLAYTQNNGGFEYGELDAHEAETSGTAGTTNPSMTVWDLTVGNNSFSPYSYSSNSYPAYLTTLTYTSSTYHCWELVWVTAAQNDGVHGLLLRYVDNVHVSSADVTYTATTGSTPAAIGSGGNFNGVFYINEANVHALILDGSLNWFQYNASVTVRVHP